MEDQNFETASMTRGLAKKVRCKEEGREEVREGSWERNSTEKKTIC